MGRETKKGTGKRKKTSSKKKSLQKKYVKKAAFGPMTRAEAEKPTLKCVDFPAPATGVGTPILNAGSLLVLCNGTQAGAGFWNRIGENITMKSVQIQAWILPTYLNAAASPPCFARMILFYDAQSNGAPPAWGDLLRAYDQSGSAFFDQAGYINPTDRRRFTILRDWKFLLPNLGINGAAGGANMVTDINSKQTSLLIDEYVPLGGLEAQYKLSTGLIGDITSGSIHLGCILDRNDNLCDTAWHYFSATRLRFYG